MSVTAPTGPDGSSERRGERDVRLPGFAVGLAPWALYLVMPHPGDRGALVCVAVTATVVALVLTWWSRARSGTILLGCAAMSTFAVFTVAVLVGGEPGREWVRLYSPAATLWVLAAVMVLSLRTVPVTERYARQALPESYWQSPLLHSINRRISLVWAGCAVAAAVSVTVAATAGPVGRSTLSLTLVWLVPVGLILLAGRYTEFATTARAHRSSDPRMSPRGDPRPTTGSVPPSENGVLP